MIPLSLTLPFPMNLKALTVPALALTLVAAGAWQQSTKVDFKTSLEKANKAYEQKAYGEAMRQIRSALQLVQTARADAVRVAMPAAPAGLKIEDSKNDEALLFAAIGCQVDRRYADESGNKSLKLSVQADSPFIAGVLPMLTNPVIVQANHGEILEYGKNKAVLSKDGDDGKNWKLQIVVDNQHLINVEANGFEKAELLKMFDDAAVGKLAKEISN